MRKLFFALFVLFSAESEAQHKYIPIPKDSAIWVTVDEDWHEGEPGPPPHSFSYSVGWFDGKDTIVNGQRYSCYYGEDPNIDMPPKFNFYSAYVAIWIRQDTSSKKVWLVRSKISLKEDLIYDFSLQVGDTVTDTSHYFFNKHISPHKAWVDQIDSVFWGDGLWRYRWFIKSNYGPAWGAPAATAVQIEGMGYTNGFYYDPFYISYPTVGRTHQVVCFNCYWQWLYHIANPWNADCDSLIAKNVLSVASLGDGDLERPLLFPSPVSVSGQLFVNRYAGPMNKTIFLDAYNTFGIKALSLRCKPGEAINLSNYNLPTGTYLFYLADEKQKLISRQKIATY